MARRAAVARVGAARELLVDRAGGDGRARCRRGFGSSAARSEPLPDAVQRQRRVDHRVRPSHRRAHDFGLGNEGDGEFRGMACRKFSWMACRKFGRVLAVHGDGDGASRAGSPVRLPHGSEREVAAEEEGVQHGVGAVGVAHAASPSEAEEEEEQTRLLSTTLLAVWEYYLPTPPVPPPRRRRHLLLRPQRPPAPAPGPAAAGGGASARSAATGTPSFAATGQRASGWPTA